MTVAVAISLLGQNVPAEKQPTPRPTDLRIRVSEGVLERMVLKKVLPQPPWSSDPAHGQGVITIAILVDYDGTLKSTSLISGDPVLANIAEHAIQQWQFKPYLINGESVQVESRVEMKFSKKRAEVVLSNR